MNAELLDMFLEEEVDTSARRKLLAVLYEYTGSHAAVAREYTFNRFNVLLDFGSGTVLLQDDLTVGSEGEYELGMDEFAKAVEAGHA